MTPFSQRWGFWSRVALKDGGDDGGGGGGGGDGWSDNDSFSAGKFEDSRSELEAKGYTVSDDGKSVYNDNGQVAGEGWSGSSTVNDIVSGGGDDGGSDRQETFNEAFAAARAAQGAGGTFTWNGQQYSTETAEDVAARNAAAQAEANRQALLESQMAEERRNRAAQEARAVAEQQARDEAARQQAIASQMEAEQRARAEQAARAAAEAERQRQAQAEAQAEANRQAQAAREEADRQARAEVQAEANRQAQAAQQAEAERQRQAELAAQMEAEARAADIERLPDVVGPGQTAEEYFAQNPQELVDFREQQDREYQDMLARAEARERERLAAQFESEAEAAGLTRPGQTMPGDTFQATGALRVRPDFGNSRPSALRLLRQKSLQIWLWPQAGPT
jgi:hypothetical protein